MSEQEHIEHQNLESSEMEERLHYECEQAFLRREFEEPSAELEWEAFQHRVQKPRSYRKWIVSVASVAAVLVVGIFLFRYISIASPDKSDTLTLYTASETPLPVVVEEQSSDKGSSTRTVISETETGVVKQGVVFSAKEADYSHPSSEHISTNVVSIPSGQVYKIILSDGTEVWLNADSRLIFPTRFVGSKRQVRLEGEAYFNVARNERAPFVIETDKITTQVLGTEFNVKTYKNSDAHVTLVDGSVKVLMSEINAEVLLKPGEDIAYADEEFQIKEVDTSYYTQWRDGYFYFDDMYLSDILSDLGRWYNITIEIERDSLLMNQKLHFIADRDEDIDHVVENLNAFNYLSVTKKENKLLVRRKN